jgi:hypothetical protein
MQCSAVAGGVPLKILALCRDDTEHIISGKLLTVPEKCLFSTRGPNSRGEEGKDSHKQIT